MDNFYGAPEPYTVALGTTKEPTVGIPIFGVIKVTIHPNPVENWLYINRQHETIDRLTITDLTGRNMLLETNFTAEALNVSGLSPGVYILRMTIGNQTVVMKFIKK